MATSWTAGEDNVVPPQNNGTLVYRVMDGQWFWIPHVSVTCFEVWRTKDDMNELHRGDYHNTILREDITEGINTKDGEGGQIPFNPDGMPSGIHDSDHDGVTKPEWIVDEWVGATMYLFRVGEDIFEYAEVASNTADKLTGTAGTFKRSDGLGVDGDDHWQLPEVFPNQDNPSRYDYYSIIRAVKTNGTITIKYKSPKQTVGDVKRLKQFIEILLNIYATGAVTLRWTVDKVKSGSMTFDPSQGSTKWGTHQWGESVAGDGSTLLWTDIDDMMFERNFPTTAEGRFIEFEVELETSDQFELSLLAMGYFLHGGQGWLK